MRSLAVVVLTAVGVFLFTSDVDGTGAISKDIPPIEFGKIFLKNYQSRIVGGRVARSGQLPYQVGILLEGKSGMSWCGGALVAKRWILTAAHCLDGTQSVTIYLGSIHAKDKAAQAIIVNKSNFRIHSGWNTKTLANDIGLIKLTEDARLSSNIKIINLPSESEASKNFVGYTGIASGWGRSSDNSNSVTEVLRYTELRIITEAECKWSFHSYIRKSNICTSGSDKKSTCNGDSGGPLVYGEGDNRVIIGVTSFGSADGCQKGYPAVFTRVGHYLHWIKKYIN